jgi:hypothetical protein
VLSHMPQSTPPIAKSFHFTELRGLLQMAGGSRQTRMPPLTILAGNLRARESGPRGELGEQKAVRAAVAAGAAGVAVFCLR